MSCFIGLGVDEGHCFATRVVFIERRGAGMIIITCTKEMTAFFTPRFPRTLPKYPGPLLHKWPSEIAVIENHMRRACIADVGHFIVNTNFRFTECRTD